MTVTLLIVLDGVTTSGSGNILIAGLPYSQGSVSGYGVVMKVGYNDVFADAIHGAYITGSGMTFIPTGVTQGNYQGVVSTGYLGITGTYIANT